MLRTDGQKMFDKSFLFSRDELAMLLSKFGIKYFYGFDLSADYESPRKYIVLMNRLIKAGFLSIGEKNLKFSSELSEVLMCIADCSYVLVFYPSAIYDGVKCCYISGNKTVLSQVYDGTNEKIKLTLADTDEIYDYISHGISMGYSAEYEEDLEPDYKIKEIISFAEKSFPTQNASELRSFEYIEWVADIVEKNSGNILQRCFAINGEECSYIVKTEKNNVDINMFTDGKVKQYLFGFLDKSGDTKNDRC